MSKTSQASSKALEEMFESASFRLNQERSDFLLPQILDFVQTKRWLNIHPEYQRRLVWDTKKRSKFIESLLMNIPIPPIFLYEYEYSRYEVIDGQQRLSSILDYYGNKFKLAGLEYWSDLNGRSFSELPPLLQRGLDRRRISATVLLVESSSGSNSKADIRKFVFERLNTGGQNLSKQELRNCIYSGPFNDLILELVAINEFNDAVGMPRYSEHIIDGHIGSALAKNGLYKRMKDCELVLRYFAFRRPENVYGSIDAILDRTMEEPLGEGESLSLLKNVFVDSLLGSLSIFGDKTFMIPDKKTYKLSMTLFDAEMIAVERLLPRLPELIQRKERILSKLLSALANREVYELLTGKKGTAGSIKGRADYLTTLFQEVLDE